VHQRITHNLHLRECDRDRKDLRNIIDDRRRLSARSPTPPRRSPARDVTPSGRGSFCALAPSLRQVVWPEKFKAGHINKYDGSNNPEEFIHIYYTVIEAARGDNWVKTNYLPTILSNVNYLPTTLSNVARSLLINLPEGSIYTWDQLCAMFIENFQGTYERPSTTETLKTTRQKYDESLWNYVKHFCNVRLLSHISRTLRSSTPSMTESATLRLWRRSP
jgi:hypothetical protein